MECLAKPLLSLSVHLLAAHTTPSMMAFFPRTRSTEQISGHTAKKGHAVLLGSSWRCCLVKSYESHETNSNNSQDQD